MKKKLNLFKRKETEEQLILGPKDTLTTVSLVYSTSYDIKGNDQTLCLKIDTESNTKSFFTIFNMMSFIKIAAIPVGQDNINFFISGTTKDYKELLMYLTLTLKEEDNVIITNIIRLIQENLKLNSDLEELCELGILNKSSFINPDNYKSDAICDLDFVNNHDMQFLNEMNNSIYDIIHFIKKTDGAKNKNSLISIRKAEINGIEKDTLNYIYMKYDLKHFFGECWLKEFNGKYEDIDEVLE